MRVEATGSDPHHIRVRRTARIHTLGPTDPARATDAWVVLHGYRQLAGRFLRRFRVLDDGTRLVVAPEGLSRFYVERETSRHGPESLVGASWMTREEREHEIRDYVDYLDEVGDRFLRPTPSGSRIPLTVLGFSQGVATAARWVTRGRHPCRRLICWGDTLPPDLDSGGFRERMEGVELVLVRGEVDGSRRPDVEARQDAMLGDAGIPFRIVTHGEGHRVQPDVVAELAQGFGRRP